MGTGGSMISYEPFWKRLKECEQTQTSLIRNYNISPCTLSRIKMNASISMDTIEKLCHILCCDIKEIVKLS